MRSHPPPLPASRPPRPSGPDTGRLGASTTPLDRASRFERGLACLFVVFVAGLSYLLITPEPMAELSLTEHIVEPAP